MPMSTKQRAKMEQAIALSRASKADIVEVLEGTRRALMLHGWTQGRRMRRDGSMCLSGAITFAVNPRLTKAWGLPEIRSERESRLIAATGAALATHIGAEKPDQLVTWNDQKGRTRPEVLELLQSTVKEIEDL